jgi:hypothetical protein
MFGEARQAAMLLSLLIGGGDLHVRVSLSCAHEIIHNLG